MFIFKEISINVFSMRFNLCIITLRRYLSLPKQQIKKLSLSLYFGQVTLVLILSLEKNIVYVKNTLDD